MSGFVKFFPSIWFKFLLCLRLFSCADKDVLSLISVERATRFFLWMAASLGSQLWLIKRFMDIIFQCKTQWDCVRCQYNSWCNYLKLLPRFWRHRCFRILPICIKLGNVEWIYCTNVLFPPIPFFFAIRMNGCLI